MFSLLKLTVSVMIDEEMHWNNNLLPAIMKTLDDNNLIYDDNNKYRTDSEIKGITINSKKAYKKIIL